MIGEKIENIAEYVQPILRKEFNDDNLKVIQNNDDFIIIFSNGKRYTYHHQKNMYTMNLNK